MQNNTNKNKREAIQDVLALLNGATGTVSNKTSEAHTGSAPDADMYREKIRAEIFRIMDQFSDRIEATFKPFGIDTGQISARFRIPHDTRAVYEKLMQAQIAPEKERSLQAGRQQ